MGKTFSPQCKSDTYEKRERKKIEKRLGLQYIFKKERLMGSLQASYPLEESAALPALSCLSPSTPHSQSLVEGGVTLV